MAVFQHWIGRFNRWGQGRAGRALGGSVAWHVVPPADPTQPLWLVPAYQRQRRSGDRLTPR